MTCSCPHDDKKQTVTQVSKPIRKRRKRQRRPGTGNSYSKFVKQMYSSSKIRALPHKQRFAAIAQLWKKKKPES